MKEVAFSSELLQLAPNQTEYKSLLDKNNKNLSAKGQLELDYWKILLATSESQRATALRHATTLRDTTALTPEQQAVFNKIDAFVKSLAWNVQSLAFLERAQQLPVPRPDPIKLTPEKCWRYALKLKSIVSRIIEVSPEFMAEDNDAGNTLRMLGTLKELPTDMIEAIDHEWMMEVMSWLRDNYRKLCEDPQLKALVESEYDIFTSFLSDLDELETQLGLQFGLLTHTLPKKLGSLKPKWIALPKNDHPGPAESCLRSQADVWDRYRQKQTFYRIKQRMSRVVYQKHLLKTKKQIMQNLLAETCLHKISHIHMLNIAQLQEIKKTLVNVGCEVSELSALGKYIEKKLQQINTQIEYIQKHSLRSTVSSVKSSLWARTSGLIWSDPSIQEEKIIREAIKATEDALQVSLSREEKYLEIAWGHYEKSYGAQLTCEEKVKIKKKSQDLRLQITEFRKKIAAHSLEDTAALRDLQQTIANLEEQINECNRALSPLARLYDEMQQSTAAFHDGIEKKDAAIRTASTALARLDALDKELERLGIASAAPSQAKPSTKDDAKEQGIVKKLLKKIDSIIGPLARHITSKQLYSETVSDEFAIRRCDAEWICQLKHAHNLLVETRIVLLNYSASNYKKLQLLPLMNRLVTLCSQLGDIVAGIDKLALYAQESWFVPLKELLLVARELLLESSDEVQVTALLSKNSASQILVAGSQKIKEDFKELLVELPSNFPGRAELDHDLTELFHMVNDVLAVKRRISADIKVSKKGYGLFDSSEFKRLMDLIAKISGVVGSDFVREKFSDYRAQLTKHLSIAMQRVLAEEIQRGYRAGVITEALYQQVEALAGSGLVDIPTFYATQISRLNNDEQLCPIIVKQYFVGYIEGLLARYAQRQQEEWNATTTTLQKEQGLIDFGVQTIAANINGRAHNFFASTEGKNLYTQQQSLELRKAQINRHIIAKNREMQFLKAYVAAAQEDQRAALLKQYEKQTQMLQNLNSIVRKLTTVKWDIYYYDFKTFSDNVENINILLRAFESYIEDLANKEINAASLKQRVDSMTVQNKALSSVPAMQHLFSLAINTLQNDLTPSIADPSDKPENTLVQPASFFSARPANDTASLSATVEPCPTLYQELIRCVYEEVKKLDVKNDWYKRNIIEHLEIFLEMWSPEKEDDAQIKKRRGEILMAMQANNAPQYQFLSHPADVKIVYLLTVRGQYGLTLVKEIFSRDAMQYANEMFEEGNAPQPTSEVQAESMTLTQKTEREIVTAVEIEKAIKLYQRSRLMHSIFQHSEAKYRLNETSIARLRKIVRENLTPEVTASIGQKKLREIYNALVSQDYNAVSKIVQPPLPQSKEWPMPRHLR